MNGPFRLGLTGSVGMGKSTTAAMFAEAGVPVWDADAAVHRLYAAGGAGVPVIAGLVPDAIRDGAVDRTILRQAVLVEPGLLARIEAGVHPLVATDRAAFLAANAGADIVLLDIPLLYETGGEGSVDAVAVVSAPPEVQRDRVLARPGMTEPTFAAILARQVPDVEKRRRADFVIDTGQGLEAARAAVLSLIAEIRSRHA
jgi:dephospho-CoA kinase